MKDNELFERLEAIKKKINDIFYSNEDITEELQIIAIKLIELQEKSLVAEKEALARKFSVSPDRIYTESDKQSEHFPAVNTLKLEEESQHFSMK